VPGTENPNTADVKIIGKEFGFLLWVE
jgi:hypothetical protein